VISVHYVNPSLAAGLFAILTLLASNRLLPVVALAGHVVVLSIVFIAGATSASNSLFSPQHLLSILIAGVGLLYALFSFTSNRRHEKSAAFLYIASGFVCLNASTFGQFFFGLEALTFSALPIIISSSSAKTSSAALHYCLMHLAAGGFFLAGIILRYCNGESLALTTSLSLSDNSLSSWLIFLGLGVNCAWPLLHSWLLAAYQQTSPSGILLLSAVTTKVALFGIWQMFPGEPLLIPIGLSMAVFPLIYMMVENDLRRIFCYSIINQLGYMVVAIGIGSHLALNGALGFLIADVLYKALLLMGLGVFTHQLGIHSVSELKGLARLSPVGTLALCIGAWCLCAMPYGSGFVTKSLIVSAAAREGYFYTWLVLLGASASSALYLGVRIVLPVFWLAAKVNSVPVKELPTSMTIAVLLTSSGSIVIGFLPQEALYAWLPFSATYEPYSLGHVTSQVQIIFFAILAGSALYRKGYVAVRPQAATVDVDQIYSLWFAWLFRVNKHFCDAVCVGCNKLCSGLFAGTRTYAVNCYNGITGQLLLLGNSERLTTASSQPIEFMPIGLSVVSILGAMMVGLLLCLR
jgi:multicomponent Na+:H+ antiporter subunit D